MTGQESMANYLQGRTDFNWTDNLPSRLFEIIRNGRKHEEYKPIRLEDVNWRHLGKIVRTYLDARADMEGYINKTEAAKIAKVQRRARQLLNDLDELEKEGLLWCLAANLNKIEKRSDKVSGFREELGIIARLSLRSPKLQANKDGPGKQSDQILSDLHAEMQTSLDQWWKKNTGLPKNVSLDFDIYQRFLLELFKRFRLSNSPGPSHSAVQAARKRHKNRQLAYNRRMEEFAVALNKLKESLSKE